MKPVTPGEELLRSKYDAYNSLDQRSGGDVIKSFNQPSRVRAVQKPMKMIIKSPTKQPEPVKKKTEGSSLAAFEKAKRILAAEAQAKLKAEEAKKEKAKLALKQKLSAAKSLKRPLVKRAATLPVPKQAKVDGDREEGSIIPMRKQQPQASSLAFHPQAQAEERERGAEAVLKEDEYKTIYASKLPDDCEEEELSDLFNKYGSVANISSIYQPRDKKDESKYAFVTFEDAEVARRIVHMSTIGRRPPLLRNSTTLYINWAKESLPVLQKAGNNKNNNNDDFDSTTAPTTTARPMTRHREEGEGGGGFAQTKAKAQPPSSDADGRNMVTYDDDFL